MTDSENHTGPGPRRVWLVGGIGLTAAVLLVAITALAVSGDDEDAIVGADEKPQPVTLASSPDEVPFQAGKMPAQPADDSAKSNANNSKSEPVDKHGNSLRAGWSWYRHPLSDVAFQYPEGWSVRLEASGILITPADHAPSREMLFGYCTPSPGVTDAASIQVSQPLDLWVASVAPEMRRAGKPEAMDHDAGSAARYVYRGMLPDGRQAVSEVYVLVADGLTVSLSILADEAKLAERSPTLREMFATLTTQAPPVENKAEGTADSQAAVGDRRLIGMFKGEAISSNVEGIYINTQLVYAFGADGVVLNGARSHMNAEQRDHNQDLVWTAHGDTGGNVERGRWEARDGLLTIRWDNGQRSLFAYGFEPDGSLVLRNPQTKKLINFFPRLR